MPQELELRDRCRKWIQVVAADVGERDRLGAPRVVGEGEHGERDHAARGLFEQAAHPVEVDADPPVNALTLSSVNGAFLSGNTVFYRGVAIGSFSVTNALSDTDSGVASSATATRSCSRFRWRC